MTRIKLQSTVLGDDGRPVHTFRVSTPCGEATLVLRQANRRFEVTHFEVDSNPDLSLAFGPDGPGIENLDTTSDMAQCFNVSSKVSYVGVLVGALEMRASCVEELTYALSHVKFRPYNHEEI